MLALMRAEAVTRQADAVAALTLEVLKGTTRAFDAGTAICKSVDLKIKLYTYYSDYTHWRARELTVYSAKAMVHRQKRAGQKRGNNNA